MDIVARLAELELRLEQRIEQVIRHWFAHKPDPHTGATPCGAAQSNPLDLRPPWEKDAFHHFKKDR